VRSPCGVPITSVSVVKKPSPSTFDEVWTAESLPNQAQLQVVLFRDNAGYSASPSSLALEPGADYVVSVNDSNTGTIVKDGKPPVGSTAWDTEVSEPRQFATNDARIRHSIGVRLWPQEIPVCVNQRCRAYEHGSYRVRGTDQSCPGYEAV